MTDTLINLKKCCEMDEPGHSHCKYSESIFLLFSWYPSIYLNVRFLTSKQKKIRNKILHTRQVQGPENHFF